MARTRSRPEPSKEKTLRTRRTRCPCCGKIMWSAYMSRRTIRTLQGVCRIHLHVRRCRDPSCSRYHRPYRPEAEGRWALPQHEFGWDVIAVIGALRYQQHRTVPEIHQELRRRGLGTRARSFQAKEPAPENLETWQTVRATLEKRRQARTLRRRFRRNPQGYLRELEGLLLKRALPP
jgi:hypothetical protein